MAPTAVLVVAAVAMGVLGQPVVALAERAAASLRDPREYIAVVLRKDAMARSHGRPAGAP
jgi:hypothetical protein